MHHVDYLFEDYNYCLGLKLIKVATTECVVGIGSDQPFWYVYT